MINKKFKNALTTVARLFNENDIDWFLMGTVNHSLQGMKRNPNDIDVIVRFERLEKVRRFLENYHPSEIEKLSDKESAFELKINNVPVEVIGEKRIDKYFNNKNEFLVDKRLNNTKIPCRKLEEEIEFYKRLGRDKRVKEIKGFLDSC